MAVFNAECEHCQAVAREFGAQAAKSAGMPPIYVLMCSAIDTAVSAFARKTRTNYPHCLISESEFFNLIGNSPPRVYWLRDGKVRAHWDEEIARNILSVFNLQTTGKSQNHGELTMRNQNFAGENLLRLHGRGKLQAYSAAARRAS